MTDQGNGAARGGVQSIDRAVAILRCFDARHPTLGISEIARATGLSTTTTHRLLAAMQANRLVRQTSDRRYGLGPLMVQLARSGALPTTLRDAALPVMTALRDEVDETVALHELLPSGERVVVDQVESHQELRRTYTDIGVPIPLPHGAPGKAILSMLPLDRQERWLSRPIQAVTPHTVTDPEALRAELAEARARGWAGSNAERTSGIRAVAAPIFDHTGSVVGALGLSVPAVRMDDVRAEQLGARVRDCAWQVSEVMGATTVAVRTAVERAEGRVTTR
ncbi:IclR family transcriptional regulator [Geodermatophilus sp. URMC 61]|uniref:IclR family transcriptional regulator n=1 Tax=Geodermatophilus sp. URMC 61 TaxID=3423411 RepID=UPI00406CD288